MSYIPDCRTDDFYNEKYLNEKDKEYIQGFDWCVDTVIESFVDNLDIFRDEFNVEGSVINLALFLENNADVAQKLRDCMKDWAEMERDQLITSMIDSMDENEYAETKRKVDESVK